ncbi:Hypothetical predicted protein [Olea europaea subsp. europaea]|uniref:Uncharacterized protein n=1 Tax=Olea europaea subsp. europaea TaxID=158383 RepID=A0A8S0P9Q8_OLEEU|nr:Hypothetical predicted protein [Olea europaea subsp. europaea]
MTQKRCLTQMKNIKPSHLKRQMTIDESLKKPIAANPIFSIKIIDIEEQVVEDVGLIKKKGKEVDKRRASKGKAQNFLVGRSNEIAPAILELLPSEVQATDAEAETKRLRVEPSTTNEVIEAFKVKHAEAELRMRPLQMEMKKEVHPYITEVSALIKRVENSDNLHKIDLLALEMTKKEKVELKSQVGKLTIEVASLKQQLSKSRESAVHKWTWLREGRGSPS